MKKHTICRHFFRFLLIVLLLIACANSTLALRVSHPTANSYEEYLEEIKKLDVPDFYVRYEHIRVLGDFVLFSGDSQSYYVHYKIIDRNGFEGSFDVKPKSFLKDNRTYLVMPDNLADMLSLPTNESGTIRRGPLHYQYTNGKLTSILWIAGNVEFSLSGYRSLDNYPMDKEETILSRLLSPDREIALTAYRELMSGIPLQPGESIFNRAPYRTIAISTAVLLVVCGAVACVWIERRRRRMRHED